MRGLIYALLILGAGSARALVAPNVFVKGLVQIRPGQNLWVEQRQAARGKPTLFLLNGLTYSTDQWQALVAELDQLDPTIGLVLYDMDGMGQTVLHKPPIPYDIPFENQVRDLKDLIRALDIQGPLIAAGLSYGGGVGLQYLAEFPTDFDKMIAMDPMLGVVHDMDQRIRQTMAGYRLIGLFAYLSDDDLYNLILRGYVATFPLLEPSVLGNPWKLDEAVRLPFKLEELYRMTKGSKSWKALDIVNQLPQGKLYLLSGENDILVPLASQNSFWQSLPPGVGQSHVVLSHTGHKLPEEQPALTAKLLMRIINSEAPVALSQTVLIPAKASFCEFSLSRNP